MSTAETSSKTPEIVLGNGGLNIPVGEAWVTTSEYDDPGRDFIRFFRRLFKENGHDLLVSDKDEKAASSSVEIRIPAQDDLSWLVIKGSYQAADKSELEYKLRRSRESAEWGRWSSVTAATETYGIYNKSAGVANQASLISVQYLHETGGNNGYYRSPYNIRHLGRYVIEQDFGDRSDGENYSVDRFWETARQGYREHAAVLMSGTVELLTGPKPEGFAQRPWHPDDAIVNTTDSTDV
jgi:hypothetical protein